MTNGEVRKLMFWFSGECKSIPDCEEGELEDFPRRMREWLFNVMEELADRGQLTPHFSKLHKEGGEVEFIKSLYFCLLK